MGAALIIFIVYLVMLYVATSQPLYVFAGLGAGAAASVVAYYLFNHVRVRVIVWQDPFAFLSEWWISGGTVFCLRLEQGVGLEPDCFRERQMRFR